MINSRYTRITCPCGSSILNKSKKTHELTKHHQYYLEYNRQMKTDNPEYQRRRLNNDTEKRMKQRQACRDYYERNKNHILATRKLKKKQNYIK